MILTNQPLYPARVDTSHDIGNLVRFAAIGADMPVDLYSGTMPGGTAGTIGTSAAGTVYYPAVSSVTWPIVQPDVDTYLQSITVLWYGTMKGNTSQTFLQALGSYGWYFLAGAFAPGFSTLLLQSYWSGSAAGATVPVVDDALYALAARFNFATNTVEMFVNGESAGAPAAWVKDPGLIGPSQTFGIMNYGGGAACGTALSAVCTGMLTNEQIGAWSSNPWIIFEPEDDSIDLVSTASGSITGAGQIATTEAIGQPAVSVAIAAAGVTTAEAIGQAVIIPTVGSAGIVSAETIGDPTLSATITAAGIATAAIIGQPNVGVSVQEITGAGGLTTAEAIGTHAVGAVVAGTAIDSAEALGSAALSPTVAAAGIVTAEALGQPNVGVPAQEITGTGQVVTAEALGGPAVSIGIETVGLTTNETIGSAALAAGITTAGIASVGAVGAPAVGEILPAAITGAGGIASSEAFGSATIHPLVPYTGTGFQIGSGNRRPRANRRESLPAKIIKLVPHRIGAAGVESQERLGYPAVTWRGRSRNVRDAEFLLGRAA